MYNNIIKMEMLSAEHVSFSQLSELINNFKNFLATSDLVVSSYKRNPIESLDLLTYTLYFFEQVQKKNEPDDETNMMIYNKLTEINSLWQSLLEKNS